MVPLTVFLNVVCLLVIKRVSCTDILIDRTLKSLQKRQAQNEVIDLRMGGRTQGIGGTNTPTPTPAGEYIRIALEEANAELQFQKNLDKQMLLQGVDQAPGGHSYFWHLGRFLYTKNREKVTALSDKAWVSVQVTKKLRRMTGMTVAELQRDPEILSEWRRQVAETCPFQTPTCTPMSMRYRTADGSCNNLNDVPMGAAYTRQRRMMDNSYEDGIDAPRVNGVTGDPLPSPRLISNVIHKAGECSIANAKLTVLVMQFAQFMEHDVISTPMITGEDGADIMCCDTAPEITARRAACFPIEIPPYDERFKEHCMTFSRSTPGLHPNCDIGIRSPLNQATAWMDSSQTYGTELEEMVKLRVGRGGLMNMTVAGFPPESDEELCIKEEPGDYCMAAGDFRVNHVPGLTVMHVMFLRMHNKIAMKLNLLNPMWNDEKIFQETRKIVVAIQQHIVYNELFPKIFDKNTMRRYGLYSTPKGYNTVYDSNVDGSIMMGFSAAAMRFPHTRIPDVQSMVNKMFTNRVDVPIFNTFDKPKFVLQRRGNALNDFARWLTSFPAMADDRFVEDGVRDFLFLDERGHSFDLVSLNIQRARDQGIPPYNRWRQLCGLPPARFFASVEGGLVDHTPEVATLLATVYHHVDDIDLFTGGISETQIPGSALGPTFSCIIASQFRDLKRADRFWYENHNTQSGFTEAQLNEIKKITLSKLMCSHLDVPMIQRDPFAFASKRNPRVRCDEIQDLDFEPWRGVDF